ncbi:MAG: hypothetical protein WA210_05415, partial [Burkholderiaceae bacterium]
MSASPASSLAVRTLGYLVPRAGFNGRIHSVFEQACNMECDATLLTLCTSRGFDGPTHMRLAHHPALDLRRLFCEGEPVACRDGWLRAGKVELDLAHATLWEPARCGTMLPAARSRVHLQRAGAQLALRRSSLTRKHRAAPSFLDPEGHEGAPLSPSGRLPHGGGLGAPASVIDGEAGP